MTEVTGAGAAVQGLWVLIVQDHPLLAGAIAEILEGEADFSVHGIARTGVDAASVAARERVDIALIDLRLPDVSGPTAAGMIRDISPETVIVFQGGDESETDLLDAIDAGASAM